ncbi:hypothetical protein GCM10010282_59090 [Streptomyces roseolus]|nr:hypothetical protein GCM10010282_59090 [Streptomyces roseolus]
MTALEATALLLAEHINRIAGDRDYATRMIGETLSRADREARSGFGGEWDEAGE